MNLFSGRSSLPLNQYALGLPALQATSPHQSQQSTVDVGQLHDPQTYTQHAIQVQHIQVTEPTSSTPSSSQVCSPTPHPGLCGPGDPGNVNKNEDMLSPDLVPLTVEMIPFILVP